MKNVTKGIVKLILILALIAGSVYVGMEAAPAIKLGLDLDGGVSITYQAKEANPTAEQMGDAVYKLQLKAQDYSSEAEVYQEGNNKVNIDIPGVSDANSILEELGKPGTLYFVEGNITWPLLATDSEISSPSEVSPEDLVTGPGVEGFTSTDKVENVDNITSDMNNIHLEGADMIKKKDGSIQIGGTLEEGDTIIKQGSTAPAHEAADDTETQDENATDGGEITSTPLSPEPMPNYDFSKPPIFDESQIVVSGNDITSARGGMTQDNYGQTQYVVDLAFTEEGKQKFAEATERNLQQPIYIIYNGEIVSAPFVQSVISDGRAQITGMGDLESADRLASTIRIGALPLELEVIRSNVVGAKLGEEAISTSVKAGLIGFAIVCLFMIILYRLPGLAASLALTMYVGLTMFFIKEFGVTLTLPGIAGIILSIGMAVDANVIIFTRIQEEIGHGKSVSNAVKEGHHKALSAIIDGNITTLIAAAVLNFKGTGSVKGFAATLALGIALSMFTALFVTRFILITFLNLGLDNEVLYGKKIDRKEPINFIGFRKISYILSLALIVCGIAFIGINTAKGVGPFNYGLDFKGGASTNVTFNEKLSPDDVDKKVVPIFEKVTNSPDIQTQIVNNSNEVIIKTRTLTPEESKEIYSYLMGTPSEATENEDGLTRFGVPSNQITNENISGVVSTQMKKDAFIAVVISTILMLIYIWFRFKDVKFAGSAVLALLHDCAVTVGFYAVFRWTVDSTFIACMLTLVGYSINATIVIFDRIREDLGRHRGMDRKTIVNLAITETFSRSINTSITTLIMVIVLYIMGVSSIKLFALPLIIGIICGGYSSICITGPLWYDLKNNTKETESVLKK